MIYWIIAYAVMAVMTFVIGLRLNTEGEYDAKDWVLAVLWSSVWPIFYVLLLYATFSDLKKL